ncbi:hypothetical protein CB1_001907061 [Camelus ferus]|nr:hypothetical protein CB1_001907061 [Camelus ferus]
MAIVLFKRRRRRLSAPLVLASTPRSLGGARGSSGGSFSPGLSATPSRLGSGPTSSPIGLAVPITIPKVSDHTGASGRTHSFANSECTCGCQALHSTEAVQDARRERPTGAGIRGQWKLRSDAPTGRANLELLMKDRQIPVTPVPEKCPAHTQNPGAPSTRTKTNAAKAGITPADRPKGQKGENMCLQAPAALGCPVEGQPSAGLVSMALGSQAASMFWQS